jgi:hypothetical protein
MRASFAALTAVLAAAAWAPVPVVQARPPVAQANPCAAFEMDVRRELGLIAQAGTAVTAAARADAAPLVPRDRGLTVTLVKQGSVTFIQPPASKRGGPDSYAGLVSLGTLPKGEWRVSASLPVWLDLVTTKLLESPAFEMQPACREMRKSVVFVQPTDAPTWLQISGGTVADVRIVITPQATR